MRYRRDIALAAAEGHVSAADGPLVGILVGSESDRERMQPALDELDARGIAYEFEVRSAHRDPDAVAEYARTARERGLRVLIGGAGLAAALPGVVAAHTDLPVIGVPLRSSLSVLDGLDALLSIVQMPPGVPVAVRRRRQREERRRARGAHPRQPEPIRRRRVARDAREYFGSRSLAPTCSGDRAYRRKAHGCVTTL